MDPSMTAEKLAAVRAKIEPWLPETVTLSPSGLKQCLRALTHKSASTTFNMNVPATYGDKHLSSCLSTIYERRYPDTTTSGEVTKAISAFVENETLAFILSTLMELSDEDIILGPDYPFADLKRSRHGMGSVFEALVNAIKKDKGYEVAVAFVESLLDAYLEIKHTPEFKQLEAPDPVSEFHLKVQACMRQNPLEYIEFVHESTKDLDAEEKKKGNFVMWAHVKGSPPHTKKGPAYGRTVRDCRKEVCIELNKDADLTSFMEQHGKRGQKKGAFKEGASSVEAGVSGAAAVPAPAHDVPEPAPAPAPDVRAPAPTPAPAPAVSSQAPAPAYAGMGTARTGAAGGSMSAAGAASEAGEARASVADGGARLGGEAKKWRSIS